MTDTALRSAIRPEARFAPVRLGQPVTIGPVVARPVSGETDDAAMRRCLDTPAVRALR